ncbi:MAG: adenosylcobinamide-GDP ribazoletransferase [Nitrospirae bacterium]|nr:adenosylcobinamide-GDP ribazoletransferase [Nitrospirota bacterium]
MRSFLIAWHFLTAVPFSGSCHDPEPRELAASMGWYPLVGLILGLALGASDLLLSRFLSDGVVAWLLILALVVLTRGLHQDGLADTLDGLAGGRTLADRLVIMRDGRIGAIGATGLVLALGLRYAGIMDLPDDGRLVMLIAMPAVGRWAMVVGAVAVPYARSEGGLAQPFLVHLSLQHVLGATLLLAVVLVWSLGPLGALMSLVGAVFVARACTAFSRRMFGGVTGDTLGAINEIVEVIFLLTGPVLVGLR